MQEQIKQILSTNRTNCFDHLNATSYSVEYLKSLSTEEVIELGFGPMAPKFFDGNGAINTSTALNRAVVYATAFLLAREGGPKLPKNIKGETIKANKEIKISYHNPIRSDRMKYTGATGSAASEQRQNLNESIKQLAQWLGVKAVCPQGEEKEQLTQIDSMEFDLPLENWDCKAELKSHIGQWMISAYSLIVAGDQPDKNFLADIELLKWLDQDKIPENVFFTDFHSPFDFTSHRIERDELLHLIEVISEASVSLRNRKQEKFIWTQEHEEGVDVWFEGETAFTVASDGKILNLNGCWMQGSLEISSVSHSQQELLESDVSLADPKGTLLKYLLPALSFMPNGQSMKAAYLYQRGIEAIAPFSNLEETGGSTEGLRGAYEQFVISEIKRAYHFPFTQRDGEDEIKPFKGNDVGEFKALAPKVLDANAEVDKAALDKFGLCRIHKAAQKFVSGHLFYVSLNEIPSKYQNEFLKSFLEGAECWEGDFISSIQKVFNLSGDDIHKGNIEQFKHKLLFMLVTKFEKATKRVALQLPVSAKPLAGKNADGCDRATRFASEESWNRSQSEGVSINIAFTKGVTMAPGQSLLINEDPRTTDMPFEVVSTHTDDVQKYSFRNGFPRTTFILSNPSKEKVHESCWVLNWQNKQVSLPHPQTGGADWVVTQGKRVRKGQLIAKLQSSAEEGAVFKTITAPEDMILQKVVFRQKGAGNQKGALEVKVRGFAINTYAKLRDFLKTIPVVPGTGKGCIYNELNPNLREGIELVSPEDSDKSSDSVWYRLRAYAQTAVQTEWGRNHIRRINAWFGEDQCESLILDARGALLGIYDEFIREFEERYQRALWMVGRDQGHLHKAQRDMYKTYSRESKEELGEYDVPVAQQNEARTKSPKQVREDLGALWYELKGEDRNLIAEFRDGKFPEFSEVFVDWTPDEIKADPENASLFANVFVFYEDEPDELGNFFVVCQRSHAIVGREDLGEDVVCPVKQELSPVSRVTSYSPVMMEVTTQLENGLASKHSIPEAPEAAASLMQDATKKAQLRNAFIAMYEGLPIVGPETANNTAYPVIPLMAKDKNATKEQLNQEFIDSLRSQNPDLVYKAKHDCLTLKDLAEALKHIVVGTPYFNIYVPALLEQERNPSSTDTMGGRILRMFSHLLATDKKVLEGAHALLDRSKRQLESLLDSDKLKTIRGRMGVYAKIQANPIVPVDELWVPYAPDDPDSYHFRLIQICKRYGVDPDRLDGMKCMFSRMPMPFPCGLKVRIIYPGDPRFRMMNLMVGWINPLVAYVEAGDFDGDDRLVILLWDHDIATISVATIMQILRDRTNKDPYSLAACGDYLGDHNQPKPGKPFKGLFSKKNLVATDRPDGKRDKNMGAILPAATHHQMGNVALSHAIANVSNYAWAIYNRCSDIIRHHFPAYEPEIFMTKPNFPLVIFEVYENPLGGLDWNAFDYLECLADAKKEGQAEEVQDSFKSGDKNEDRSEERMTNLVEKAGLNSKEVHAINEAAAFTGHCLKGIGDLPEFDIHEEQSIETFLKVASGLMFVINKGNFAPDAPDKTDLGKSGPSSTNKRHLNTALWFLNWNPEIRAELEERSVVLRTLRRYLEGSLPPSVYNADKAVPTNALLRNHLSTIRNPNTKETERRVFVRWHGNS